MLVVAHFSIYCDCYANKMLIFSSCFLTKTPYIAVPNLLLYVNLSSFTVWPMNSGAKPRINKNPPNPVCNKIVLDLILGEKSKA